MDMFLRASIFLWISVGFLSLSVKSKACGNNGFPVLCDFVLKEVCFDFVGESKTWSQARSSCEQQGGKLLNLLNNQIKIFLKNTPRETNISNLTFWLGKSVQEKDWELYKESKDVLKENCTYMKLKPLQLISTSDCNEQRGFLCTHSLWSSRDTKRTSLSAHATRSRLKRSIIDEINVELKNADEELERMEQTPGEPTDTNRDKFIETLLGTTEKLTEQIAMQNEDIIDHIINCSSAILFLSMTKCDIQSNPNPENLFEQVFEIFRLISLLLGKTTSGPQTIKHPSGTLYQNSYTPADLSNTVLGSKKDGEYVVFPSFSALKPQIGGYSTVITQLTTFSKNPHPSDENITGPVYNIILSDGNSDIKLANLTEMIEIVIPRSAAPVQTNNTVELEKNRKALTKLNVSDPYMTIFFTVEPNFNVSLALMLAYSSPPNSTHVSNQTILNKEGGYRWTITPEMLQRKPGTWYVDARLYNSTWEPGLTLKISSFMSKCVFWQEDSLKWSNEGCLVGEKSSVHQTQCLCNHLTLFGSSFFVMPNDVDISRTAELFATVTDNYVVLALLCAFFGLYLVTLLWACYADRRARSKRKMTLLEDSHPGALYNYLISVQTGNRKNSGTTADVTVKLIGSEGESETHNLTDPDKPVFERGSVDVFLLATPFPLGEVRSIRLQHNNSGGHPSWYINRVTIQDLQTRHVWHYLCGCWLSADRGDGMTKKTFNAAKNNEIASFRDIFQSRTSTGFRDEHIWVSIVDPPSRSPFTRAQRVSCCMSLLLCTMAINIAFWNLPVDKASPVVFSLGTMHIRWQEIMVGIQSGLLMFPVNILIITIFRSIKPRISSKPKKGDDSEEDMKPPAYQTTDILKDTEAMISLLSKSPRNKISTVGVLECSADLCPALDRMHEFIQLMQGESESNPHWVHCSRFLLAGLCHLVMCLEKLDGKNFLNPYNYKQTLDMAYQLVRKAEMVFSSHFASCPAPVKIQKKKRSGGCWLPWWCVFLGWFLLLSISGVSTFFTLLYGFEYGREKSIKWVMSLGLSLFQSIFILQPLKVIGIAVFFALLLKPVAVEESEEIEQVLLAQQEKCSRYTGRATL